MTRFFKFKIYILSKDFFVGSPELKARVDFYECLSSVCLPVNFSHVHSQVLQNRLAYFNQTLGNWCQIVSRVLGYGHYKWLSRVTVGVAH